MDKLQPASHLTAGVRGVWSSHTEKAATVLHLVRTSVPTGWAGLLVALLIPAATLARPYSWLQVLVPGETAAPGTATGKLNTPRGRVSALESAILNVGYL